MTVGVQSFSPNPPAGSSGGGGSTFTPPPPTSPVLTSPASLAPLGVPALTPSPRRGGLTWLPFREVVRAVAGSGAAGTSWIVRSREPNEAIDQIWLFSEGTVVPALDSVDVYDSLNLGPVDAPLEFSETPSADSGSLAVTAARTRFSAEGLYYAVDGATSYNVATTPSNFPIPGGLTRKDFVQPGATSLYTGNTRNPSLSGFTKIGGVWPEVRTHTARWLGLPAGLTFEQTGVDDPIEVTFGPVRSTFAFEVNDLGVGIDTSRRVTGLVVQAEAEKLINPDGRTRSDLSHTITPILRIGSETFEDAPFDLTGGLQTLRAVWPVNPATRRSWTQADLAAFGSGGSNSVGWRVQRPASPIETVVNTATALYTVRVFVSHVKETRLGSFVRSVPRQRDGWNQWGFLGVRPSEATVTILGSAITGDTLKNETITLYTATGSQTVEFDSGTSADYEVPYSVSDSPETVAALLADEINSGADFVAERRGATVAILAVGPTAVSDDVWTASSGIPFERIHSYSQLEKKLNRDYLFVANVFDFPGDRGKTRGLNLRGLGGGFSTGLSLTAEFCDSRFIQGVPYEIGKLQGDHPAIVMGSAGGALSSDAQPYVLIDDPDGIQVVEAPGRPYLAQIMNTLQPLSATIEIETFAGDASDLDGEYVDLVDGDENAFRFWFDSTGGAVADPTPSGATSVVVETQPSDTEEEVAAKLSAKMSLQASFIAFSSQKKVTVRNKRLQPFVPPSPQWDPTTTYTSGDVVAFGSTRYEAVAGSTGEAPLDPVGALNTSFWAVFVPPPTGWNVSDADFFEFVDTYQPPAIELPPTNLRFACRSSTENYPASRLEVFLTDFFSNPALDETVKVRPEFLQAPRSWLVVDVRLEDFGYDDRVPLERVWFGTNAEFDGWEILSLGTGETYQAFGSPLPSLGAASTSVGGTELYAVGARPVAASLRQDVDVAVALGVSNRPPRLFEVFGVSDGCVQYVELSWEAPTTPEGSYVEIQRQECEGDWQTVYNIYDLEREVIRDYEIKRNTTNCYRARVVDNLGFASAWSPTASALVLDDCCGYVFSSNRGPGLGVFYDDLAPRTYSFLSGVSFYEFESRDGALPVRADADQMEQFTVQLVVAAKGAAGATQEVELIPLERGRRLFDPLLVLSGDRRGDDGVLRRYPHICVADSDGNVWYASVKVESGVRQEPAGQYILTATVREITKSPQPVDVFATTIVEDVEIEFVDPAPAVAPVPPPPLPGNYFTLDASGLDDGTGSGDVLA